MDEHEAAAAEVAGEGVDDGQREAGGDGGVHRVAALLEDFAAGLGGELVGGGDHALGAHGRGALGAEGARGGQEGEQGSERDGQAERVHGPILAGIFPGRQMHRASRRGRRGTKKGGPAGARPSKLESQSGAQMPAEFSAGMRML